jgi:hypothetical protein
LLFAEYACFSVYRALPMPKFWASSCSDRAQQLAQITERRDERRSRAEFISRIAIVVEEADETVFWLECLVESGIVKEELLRDLLAGANELVAIFAASHRTSRR